MSSVSEFLKNNELLYKATTGVGDIDFINKVVQFDDDPNNFASGEATILFSGPPIYMNPAEGFSNLLVPIGAVQGFQDNEQMNRQPVPELGSRLKRSAYGMGTVQMSIARVLTYHSNLRHALYAWISKLDDVPDEFLFAPGEEDSPGAAHFTTMDSDLMRVPFGLLLVTISAGGSRISREYFERCGLLNAGKASQAGAATISEQVSIEATRKVPANQIDVNLSGLLKKYTIRPGNDTVVRT